jgi:hypothetical protein
LTEMIKNMNCSYQMASQCDLIGGWSQAWKRHVEEFGMVPLSNHKVILQGHSWCPRQKGENTAVWALWVPGTTEIHSSCLTLTQIRTLPSHPFPESRTCSRSCSCLQISDEVTKMASGPLLGREGTSPLSCLRPCSLFVSLLLLHAGGV